MAQALVTAFDAPIPAHIVARMNAPDGGNIVARASVNALTFEGKVWSITLDGKKTKLLRTNADGEEEPVSIFTSIVLDYSKDRGREWYGKVYDPKNPTIPDCWSEDSKTPHANCPTPVSKTCAACPNAKKGSASTQDGSPTVACGQFQKLVVIPAAKIGEFPPLRLKLKITSIYDKSGIDKHPGWHAWQQYLDHLVSRKAASTFWIPTKIKFDSAVAYPKLLFAPGKDWLDDDTLAIVEEMSTSDAVKEVLAATYDPSTASTGNKPLPEDEPEEELAAAQPAQARAAKPTTVAATGKAVRVKPSPPVEAEDEGEPALPETGAGEGDEEEIVSVAPAKPAKAAATPAKAAPVAGNASAAAKATQKAAAAKQAPVIEDDEEETTVAPPKPVKTAAAPAKANGKAPAAAAPKGTLNAPAEVGDLLNDWDDE